MKRPPFTPEKKAWFRGRCFTLLKTKAEGPFGDGRHILAYFIMKQLMDKEYFIYVMKMGERYSAGPAIKLPVTASAADLAKAQKDMTKNKATLGSELRENLES